MVKDCCILFQPIFWIRLITVGTLTIHIHMLKTVDNWVCLLIFPNNWKDKKRRRWKVKTVVCLIHFILIDIWASNGVLHVCVTYSPPPKTNMVHPKYADLGRCRPFGRGITPLRGLWSPWLYGSEPLTSTGCKCFFPFLLGLDIVPCFWYLHRLASHRSKASAKMRSHQAVRTADHRCEIIFWKDFCLLVDWKKSKTALVWYL